MERTSGRSPKGDRLHSSRGSGGRKGLDPAGLDGKLWWVRAVMRDPSLAAGPKLAAASMAWLVDPRTGEFFISHADLADSTATTRGNARKWVRALKEAGWLIVVAQGVGGAGGGENRANRYRIAMGGRWHPQLARGFAAKRELTPLEWP